MIFGKISIVQKRFFMGPSWRRTHNSNRNGKVVPVKGSFVNRKDKSSPEDVVKGEHKQSLVSGLQEIVEQQGLSPEDAETIEQMLQMPADQQLEMMVEERDNLQKHVNSVPKVGYTADLAGAETAKSLLEYMNKSIQHMKAMSIAEIQKEIDEAEKMISSSRVGFTARPFSTSEVRDYLRELEGRMEKMVRLDEPETPGLPWASFFGR
jgi:hypothetical protein